MFEDDRDAAMPDPPQTGDPRVDSAIAAVPHLFTDVPVTAHVEAYEGIHSQLHDALADLDRDSRGVQAGAPDGEN